MLTSLPNILTLSRIAVIPVVVGLFYVDGPWAAYAACALFSAAGITDWVDGYLARAWQEESVIGKFLDPIADKLLVAAVLMMLVAIGKVEGLVVLAALVILLREVMVSGLREFLAGLRVGVPVSNLAKWKTAIQMVAIGVLIVGDDGPAWLPTRLIGEAGLWIAAGLTLLTGWDYLRAGLKYMLAPAETAAKTMPDRNAGGGA